MQFLARPAAQLPTPAAARRGEIFVLTSLYLLMPVGRLA